MGFPSSAGGGVSEEDLTAAISDVLGTATAAGDTLGELETSLGGKASSSHTHSQNDITSLTSDLAAKAPLASPALTGVPTAPTAAVGTDTTQIATTEFVNNVTPQTKRVGTDQSNNSTSTVAITDLQFTLENSKKYAFEFELDVSANATSGMKLNLNGSASLAELIGVIQADSYASPPVNLIHSRRTSLGGSSPNWTTTTSAKVRVIGTCKTNVSGGGTFSVQFGTQTGSNACSVLTGSWARLTEIP